MKVQVIYASLTGCTRRLAQAIFDAVPTENKSIHDLADGIPQLDGDIILAGYWCMGKGPNQEMQQFLSSIQGKAVGIFCTLGYYADTAYAHSTVETGISLVKDRNQVIGGFVCNGAVASSLKKGQGKDETALPTEQKELRWEMIANHPTAAECNLAAERFRERITLYEKAKALGIPFQSIL